MKNLMIKLTLIAVIFLACNTAMAVLSDFPGIQALMHCDETNQAIWLTTPDDASSGRATNDCILNVDKSYPPFTTNDLTKPTLMPTSPEGGSYFSFDGVDDSINLDPGWLGGTELVCDLSFRARSFAPDGEYSALVSCDAFTCFLSLQYSVPHISLMIQQAVMIDSEVIIEADTWYNVSISVINDDVSITVNGSTYTEHSTWAFPDVVSPLAVGYAVRSGTRYLDGDMDEIRIGNSIPEPFTFGLIGLFGLLALRLRK